MEVIWHSQMRQRRKISPHCYYKDHKCAQLIIVMIYSLQGFFIPSKRENPPLSYSTYPCCLIGPFPLRPPWRNSPHRSRLPPCRRSFSSSTWREPPGALRASHARGDSPAFIVKTVSRLEKAGKVCAHAPWRRVTFQHLSQISIQVPSWKSNAPDLQGSFTTYRHSLGTGARGGKNGGKNAKVGKTRLDARLGFAAGDRCSHRRRQVSSAQTSSGAAETPKQRSHSQARALSGGSCACVCSALASRSACARPAAWGTCTRMWEKKKKGREERGEEREKAFNAVFNSCRRIWSNVRFAFCLVVDLLFFFFFFLVSITTNTNTNTPNEGAVSSFTMVFLYESIMQVLWRICWGLYVVIIIAWVGSRPDPTSCCIIIADGKAKCKGFGRAWILLGMLSKTFLKL